MNKFYTYFSAKTAILVLIFVALCMTTACDKKNSVGNLGIQTVTIKVDWSASRLTDTPESAEIYVYPPTGGSPEVLSSVGESGATVQLSGGVNNVAMHNSNFRQIQIRDYNYYSTLAFELSELASVSLPDGAGQAQQPELPTKYLPNLEESLMLISANSSIRVAGQDSMSVTLVPREISRRLRFIINIPTTFNVKNVTGALSGVASKVYAQTTTATTGHSSNALIEFETTREPYKIVSEGEIGILGITPNNNTPESTVLSLYIETEIYVIDFINNYHKDLTEYLNEFASGDITITLDATDPDPDAGDSLNFEITVEPWIQEDGGDLELQP